MLLFRKGGGEEIYNDLWHSTVVSYITGAHFCLSSCLQVVECASMKIWSCMIHQAVLGMCRKENEVNNMCIVVQYQWNSVCHTEQLEGLYNGSPRDCIIQATWENPASRKCFYHSWGSVGYIKVDIGFVLTWKLDHLIYTKYCRHLSGIIRETELLNLQNYFVLCIRHVNIFLLH